MSKNFEGACTYDFEDFAKVEVETLFTRIRKQPGFAELQEKIRREGFDAGQDEMRREKEAERQELVKGQLFQLQSLLGELSERRQEFLTSHGDEIINLSCAVARRVVRVEAACNHDVVMEKLKICLLAMERESSYLIKVNPVQADALSFLLKENGKNLMEKIPYRIQGDRRVPLGGLVLEGDHSRLESICGDELDRIEQHLMEQNRQGEGTDDSDT